MPEPLLNLVMYHDVDIRFRYFNHIFYIRAMKFAADGQIYNHEIAISEEEIRQANGDKWQMIANMIAEDLDRFRGFRH